MKLEGIGYNTNGEGISSLYGIVFYVPGLLIGEIAECEIEFKKNKWGRAKIISLIKKSDNRNTDVPSNHLEIGGYEVLHMNRKEQTLFKESLVINAFKQNSKTEIKLDDMFIGKKQFRYRNKITLHNGGFYKRKTHDVIKLDDFLLTDIKVQTSLHGEVIIRKLDTIISGHKGDPKFTTDTIYGIKFTIGLGSFYQINKEVAEAAYKVIMSFLEYDKVIFDLYSGIGTITLLASKKSKYVYGVEKNKESYNFAVVNKKQNKIKNVEFKNQEVIKFLKRSQIKADIIIVDPSRSGLGKEVCLELMKRLPQRIIYLSCNPATQAADFFRLKEKYKIIYAKPFDMFPQTHHIENLIVLEKINKYSK